MPSSEAARNRVRRLRDGIQAVRDAVAADRRDDSVPDAVARTLDALYDLAEFLKLEDGHTAKTLDDRVGGDVGGETTLALVCARGAKTHRLVDFGDMYGYGTHGYGEGPYGGGWAWQEFEDSKFPLRSAWYASHVRWHLVLGPLEATHGWLTNALGLSTE